MNTQTILRASSGLVASTLLALSTAFAADAAKPAAEEKDPFAPAENYITLAGQYNGVSGDKTAFQAENWTSKNGFAGIEDFQFGKSLKNDFEIKTDGHVLVGNADYLAHINISKTDFGSFDAGYSSFRTFYDGVGGFFPSNSAWFPLADQDLHVDRSKFWAQASLALPNMPVITLRYTNEARTGTKDTTIWGDTSNTGIPIPSTGTAVTSANRKIVASYIDLDEHRQTLEGTVTHTIGKLNLQASVIGETIDNEDTRYLNKYPGEARPTGGTAPAFWPWYQGSNAISGYHTQGVKTDALTFLAKAEMIFNEKITAFIGASYQSSDSEMTGIRPLTTSIAVGTIASYTIVKQLGGFTGATIRGPGSYQDFTGDSDSKILTVNAGVDLKPFKNLFVDAALKVEDRNTESKSSLYYNQYQVNQTTGAVTNYSLTYRHDSQIDERAWIPELGVRYTGIKNISLYGSADYRYSPGTEDTAYRTATDLITKADVTENHGNYTLGANWVPCTFFTGRAEVFYKDHRNDFYKNVSTAPTDQGQFILGSKYSGTRLSATVKPLATLSSTTRYVYQTGTMDLAVAGNPVVAAKFTTYAKTDSADITSHQISETIDWTPVKQVYLQANLNVTFDTTQTAYPTPGTTSNDVIRNSDNNYFNASLLAGFVVDKVTNAELQYNYYKADNFQSDIWLTQPYGAGEKNYAITGAVKRKLTGTLVAELKVGYLSSQNDTTGGNTDYKATVAYISLQQAF
jgi:hypothetical protein